MVGGMEIIILGGNLAPVEESKFMLQRGIKKMRHTNTSALQSEYTRQSRFDHTAMIRTENLVKEGLRQAVRLALQVFSASMVLVIVNEEVLPLEREA